MMFLRICFLISIYVPLFYNPYLFPYQYLRSFILQPNLATASILSLYAIIYWVIGLLVFYALFSHAKKKGAIFNV